MDPNIITSLVSVFATLLAAYFAFLTGKRSAKNEENKTKIEEQKANMVEKKESSVIFRDEFNDLYLRVKEERDDLERQVAKLEQDIREFGVSWIKEKEQITLILKKLDQILELLKKS